MQTIGLLDKQTKLQEIATNTKQMKKEEKRREVEIMIDGKKDRQCLFFFPPGCRIFHIMTSFSLER